MGKQYGFYVHTDRCIQCHACEVACKSWNGVEPEIKWRKVIDVWRGQFPGVSNRTISYSCMHCEKPSCMNACPERAIYKRKKDGAVLVNPGRCIGCRSCASACPFHIPRHGSNGLMQKCNLCVDLLDAGKQPACAATCPGEALKFGPVEELAELCRQKQGGRLSAAAAPAFFVSGKLTGTEFLKLLESESN